MKKFYILIILSFLYSFFVQGQSTNIIKNFDHQLNGNFSLLEGQLIVDPSTKSVDEDHRVVLKNAQIVNGDLLINYELAAFRNAEKKNSLTVQPAIRTPNGKILLAQPKFLEGDLENTFNTNTQQLQITWNNFQNQYRFGEESISLQLNGQLVGLPPIDCDTPLEFGKQQKLLHYVIAGLSIGTTIGGYVVEDAGQTTYATYRDEVFAGASDSETTSTYNKANTRYKVGGFLKIAGYSAFGLNAAVYLFRQIRYNQKKKDYEYYCGKDKLKIQPHLGIQSNNAYAGMQLSFQF